MTRDGHLCVSKCIIQPTKSLLSRFALFCLSVFITVALLQSTLQLTTATAAQLSRKLTNCTNTRATKGQSETNRMKTATTTLF